MNPSTEFDSTRAETRQVRVAHRLAHALAHHGLQVVYQPEIDLQTRQVFSLEALCRWQDEELGPVAPDEFIAVAEARGLIVPLGEYMLERALADLPAVLQRWPQVRVAVNVSGVELARPDFAVRVAAAIRAADPALARHLEIEVTESVFHHDLPTVRQHLQALREQGLTVAIDDFGTGQSSLARLQHPHLRIERAQGHQPRVGIGSGSRPVVPAVDIGQRRPGIGITGRQCHGFFEVIDRRLPLTLTRTRQSPTQPVVRVTWGSFNQCRIRLGRLLGLPCAQQTARHVGILRPNSHRHQQASGPCQTSKALHPLPRCDQPPHEPRPCLSADFYNFDYFTN